MLAKILILDDEKTFVDSLAKLLRKHNYHVKGCISCQDALKLIKSDYFDVVICDVRVPFFGMPDGGLEMAKEIAERSPLTFTVVVSQYVTDRLVNQFMSSVNHKRYCFLTKDNNFKEKLVAQLSRILYTKQVFVCMDFHEDFEDVYELGIKVVAEQLKLKCERADEIQHNGGILEIIYESIRSAHIIIAEMTNRNPNVFYEVGYAHALGKEVILVTQNVDSIPIDLRNFNHILYQDKKLKELQYKLSNRIEAFLK